MLRYICDTEDREKPYHPPQITRFRSNVGPERLDGIVDELVEGGVIDGETVAMDATFIRAWSRQHLTTNVGGTRTRTRGWAGTGEHTTSATRPTSQPMSTPTCPWLSLLLQRTRRNMPPGSLTRQWRRPEDGWGAS